MGTLGGKGLKDMLIASLQFVQYLSGLTSFGNLLPPLQDDFVLLKPRFTFTRGFIFSSGHTDKGILFHLRLLVVSFSQPPLSPTPTMQ